MLGLAQAYFTFGPYNGGAGGKPARRLFFRTFGKTGAAVEAVSQWGGAPLGDDQHRRSGDN
jgi:hypothetical protein